jgi:hypothetical protein
MSGRWKGGQPRNDAADRSDAPLARPLPPASTGVRPGTLVAAMAALAATIAFAILLSACAPRRAAPLIVPADYASWKSTTDVVLNYPIPGHGIGRRAIHMNPTGFEVEPVLKDGKEYRDFPVGTIIAKEVWNSPNPTAAEKAVSVTCMVKAPDDPRSRAGWIWIVKNPITGGETVFTTSFCYGCHANANEKFPYGDKNPNEEYRDYVFFVPKGKSAQPSTAAAEAGEYGSTPVENAAASSSGASEYGYY